MMNLKNISIGKKLFILISAAIIFIVLIAIESYISLSNSSDALSNMYYRDLLSVQLMNENRVHQRAIEADICELMLTSDVQKNRQLNDDIRNRVKEYDENIAELQGKGLDDEQKKRLSVLDKIVKDVRGYREKVIELALANKNAEAYSLYTSSVQNAMDELNNKVKELAEYTNKRALQSQEQSLAKENNAKLVILAIGVVCLLFMLITGILIVKNITGHYLRLWS